MKMLFNSFEEEFDLPSFTIKLCYCQSRKIEIVGHKGVNNTGFKVLIYNQYNTTLN